MSNPHGWRCDCCPPNEGARLLAENRIQEFKKWAAKQPLMFSGYFKTEEAASKAMEKLTRKRSGDYENFYIAEHPEGWCIMRALTQRIPSDGQIED